MKFWIRRFNSYLLAMVLGVIFALDARGASSSPAKPPKTKSSQTNAPAADANSKDAKPEKRNKHETSTIRVHLEIENDGTQRCKEVRIDRVLPIKITLDASPVLDERDVDKAELIEAMGGFAIRVHFNDHGVTVLDATTTSYRGQRLAIFSSFGENRWLAAPMITQRIRDGVLTFTPDATREESERMVNGLNNQAAKIKKNSAF
jgi:hypothetical protein